MSLLAANSFGYLLNFLPFIKHSHTKYACWQALLLTLYYWILNAQIFSRLNVILYFMVSSRIWQNSYTLSIAILLQFSLIYKKYLRDHFWLSKQKIQLCKQILSTNLNHSASNSFLSLAVDIYTLKASVAKRLRRLYPARFPGVDYVRLIITCVLRSLWLFICNSVFQAIVLFENFYSCLIRKKRPNLTLVQQHMHDTCFKNPYFGHVEQ